MKMKSMRPVFLNVPAPQFACLKTLVKVLVTSMDCFEIPVRVLHDFCTVDGKIAQENLVNLLCDLRK